MIGRVNKTLWQITMFKQPVADWKKNHYLMKLPKLQECLSLTSLLSLDGFREEACLWWDIKAQINPQNKYIFPL